MKTNRGYRAFAAAALFALAAAASQATITVATHEELNQRQRAFISPFFNLADQRLELFVTRWNEVKSADGEWRQATAQRRDPAPIVLDSHQRIEAATLAVHDEAELRNPESGQVEERPGWLRPIEWLAIATGQMIGYSDTGAPIYPALATCVESVVTQNGLIKEVQF